MVRRIQTIRRLLPTNFLSVFDHFVMFTLKGLSFHSWHLGQLFGLWQRVFFVLAFNAKR